MSRLRALAATLLVAGLLDGCGSSASTTATTASAGNPVTGTVTVLAAASLTDGFEQIATAFETAHPGTKVALSFGASSELVTQINQGAPADVFASADQANMKKLTDASGTAGTPAVFATNSLEIITQPGNPKKITGVKDLANPDLIVVTCGPDVPIGKYAAQVFDKAGVKVTPKSNEANVKAVVSKVTLGEADAGIVYATDVQAAGAKAAGVEIPKDINVVAQFPIAVTKEAKNTAAAQAFVDFVRAADGQAILAKLGFGPPA